MSERKRAVFRRSAVAGLLVVGLALPLWAGPTEGAPPRGFVDGAALIEALGDDSVLVEVSLGRAMLKVIAAGDPDLAAVIGGLESVNALVVGLKDPQTAERARREMRAIERRLVSEGWERPFRVKESGSEVKVLALVKGEERIEGLVVMIVESDDESALVFVNVAGSIDLAALERLGDSLELPGLEDLELVP